MEAATAALSLSAGSPPTDASPGRFCVTTAINYANGLPHMGHAYEAISADVLARYHRAFGRQVLFMTGADEHGQKIAETAALRGVTPLALCDEFVSKFQASALLLSRRRAAAGPLTRAAPGAEREAAHKQRRVRAHHLRQAQRVLPARLSQVAGGGRHLPGLVLWLVRLPRRGPPACHALSHVKVQCAGGDVCDRDGRGCHRVQGPGVRQAAEADDGVLLLLQAVQVRGSCLPVGPPLMPASRYQAQLVEHITSNPSFIQPEARRNDILQRLQREPLLDLSISRTTFDWGIPLPDDPKHVMCAAPLPAPPGESR